jgi:hypothetical protein
MKYGYARMPNEQTMRCCCYQNRIGVSRRLHPRRHIWRFAEYVSFLAGAGANHYRTGIDAKRHRYR